MGLSVKSALPQLDVSSYGGQIFWLGVSFIILYVITSRFFVPAVSAVIEDRAKRIKGDLEKAEAFRSEAAKMQSEFEATLHHAREQAKAVVSGAHSAYEKEAAAQEARCREEARKAMHDAHAKADAVIASSGAEIRSSALSVAGMIVKRLAPSKAVSVLESDLRS